MSARRKLGYNWKARQRKTESNSRGRTVQGEGFRVELDSSLFGGGDEGVWDTNVQVLPSKRAKSREEEEDCTTYKRKRLSSRQRKRLLKVIEVKERKAKVGASN